MTATLTHLAPIRGVSYDKTKPETRQPWLDQRRGGITATEIRDWGTASKRRGILEFKVTGQMEDLSGNAYVNHGNLREPMIAEWIEGKFGIAPCDAVYSHAQNPRHLASPDGISLDLLTRELIVGTEDAVLSEIKTSKHNLHPGKLDAARVLVQVEPGSQFDRSNYYTQMQWQMYVMNATRTLFVWEQHNGKVDSDTQTFTPIGVPEYAWIPRDQALIDVLVNELAPKALAEIDAARTSLLVDELPPVSDLPAEDVMQVAALLKARDAESAAGASKKLAWDVLTEKYLGEGKPDMKVDLGFANFTVSTSTPPTKTVTEMEFDEAAARRRAPALMKKYDELVAKYTKPVEKVIPGKPVQKLTVTAKKGNQS